eukprot:7388472-Prymnesium_polylepis.1
MEELREQDYQFLALELDKVQAKKRAGGAAEVQGEGGAEPEFSTPGAGAAGAAAAAKPKRVRTTFDGPAKSWWADKLAAEYAGWKQVRGALDAARVLTHRHSCATSRHAPIPPPRTSHVLAGGLGCAQGHREACAARGAGAWLGRGGESN